VTLYVRPRESIIGIRRVLPGLPVLVALLASTGTALWPAGEWSFAVSGDSRNCGDVVMPAIAAGVKEKGASFYWHLGDFRKISDFDEDIQHQPEHLRQPLSISGYDRTVWDDFLQSQVAPFAPVPVYLGIGNHDTTPPKTRELFLIQFADWLDKPELREQRLRDDPNAHKLTTYYHWLKDGIDFINLDNATDSEFDKEQLAWVEKVLQSDSANSEIPTIVVGMHEALPDSISEGHSMAESANGVASGRKVYADLLKAQNGAHKHVYVLASHSHYFMDGIFNTAYLRANGGVLPGWIIGTAGAVRYALPPDWKDARAAETNVYGFLVGTVKAGGEIQFHYQKVDESSVPRSVVDKYTPEFVHWCFAENSSAR
jgi:Calcineurin-like phosphoesterase